MDWQLHWLEAEGDLGPWRALITSEVEATRRAVAQLVPLTRLDILVQRLAGAAISEIGMVRKGLFGLTQDPDNPHFDACLGDGTLRRQVAHEVHHCLRMGAIGYVRTLGDALVSEGLAGHFTGRLFNSPPEPWERAVDDNILRMHLPDKDTLVAARYDHAAWFFGSDGRRPRWLGYTLGYRIVADWLAATPKVDGDTLVTVPTETVLSTAPAGVLTAAIQSS